MLDTRLLTFLTLLEEKSYTRTANKLYITQPAVTHHIKSLEKDNNIELFKDNKTFELTQAGVLLREYALTAKFQYSQFENALSRQTDNVKSIIALTPMVSSCLKKYNYASLIQNHDLNLNVYVYGYDKIIEALLEGTIDFAIVDNSFDSSNFDSFTLATENLVLVCNPEGKYANKDRITREQLGTAILVMGEEGSGLYRLSKNAIQQKNIRLKNNIVLQSNNLDWMIKLILSYDGIGFMYESSVNEYIEKGMLKKVDLLNFKASQNLYLLFNRRAFLNNTIISLIESIKKFKVQ